MRSVDCNIDSEVIVNAVLLVVFSFYLLHSPLVIEEYCVSHKMKINCVMVIDKVGNGCEGKKGNG